MGSNEAGERVKEAVGVFKTADTLQDAIDDLMSSGFDRAELSLLAGEHTVEEKLGHKYRKVTELEDDAAVPRCCYVSTESIGDAEGGLIGGFLYVGTVAAAGAIVASWRDFGGRNHWDSSGRRGRHPHRLRSCQARRRSPCAPFAGATGPWRLIALGTDAGRRAREASRRYSQKAFGTRRARARACYPMGSLARAIGFVA